MDAHPEYCGPTPSHIIRSLAQNLANYYPLSVSQNWHHLLTDANDLLNCQLGYWKSKCTIRELRSEIKERSLGALIRYIYEKEALAYGKRRVFVKENQAYRFLPFIILAFPTARFVYLYRDPRDVALSWKLSPNHPGGIMKATEVWRRDQEAFWLNFGILQAYAKSFRLSYESLITDTIATVQSLCAFLDIPFTDQMLKFHTLPQTQTNAMRLADWGNLTKPVIDTNAGKYIAGLTPIEIQYIEREAGKEMQRLGYAFTTITSNSSNQQMEEIVEAEKAASASTEMKLSPEEQNIRERRLKVLQRIINRKPITSI